MTFAPSQEKDLLPMGFPSTPFAAASLAKTSASPAERMASASAQEADYMGKSLDWLTSWDQKSSSWRTSQTCLVALLSNEADGLAEFSQTWPRSGMMLNGTAYQLHTLEPGIGGTESGYLPTPTKSADSKGSPRGRFFGSGTCYSSLREVLRDGPDDPIYPNPKLVEEMMGFPMFHTDLQHSEMP
jgi:hypothetical protein